MAGNIQPLIAQLAAQTDPAAIAAQIIAQFEGFSAEAYADPPGQSVTYSIGYGHQIIAGDGFSTASTISKDDALALLQKDLAKYAACVKRAVTVPLAPQQLAALYSFCYNIGCGAFQKSTVVREINAGNFGNVATALALWNKSEGKINQALVRRRSDEAQLFNSIPVAAKAEADETVA